MIDKYAPIAASGRQPIAAIEPVTGEDGIERCRIMFKPQIVPVRATPKRAFQGWRYLTPEESPRDLPKGREMDDALPPSLAQALAEVASVSRGVLP